VQPPGGESGCRPGEATAPLPVSHSGEPPPEEAGQWFPWSETGLPQTWRPTRRRGRWRRALRATVITVLSLVLLSVLGFAVLLLVTPSVSNARALARAQDQAHHASYPGPPVPRRFAAALVATEDHRFYSEPGIDPIAIVRVILAKLTGRGDQGGATLYQQLAKMLYTPGQTGLRIEAEQVALAVKLKYAYSGKQILRMYASVVYFGQGFYGLQAASCGYFGTEPARLSWPEAALLAGLVQGPSADDPLAHQAQARAREMHVIGRLVATGALTQAQARAALSVSMRSLIRNAGRGCG
jgi:membrane peptidoglycan carboxypeptidase